jgi:predicted nuclease with TOPRIM domain
MKKERVRSMRDIPTVQGIRNRAVPTSREQAVAEVARLEHEKARLEREMEIWLGNQANTQKRLRQVEERLAGLEHILNPPSSKEESRRRAPKSASRAKGREEEELGWREIRLEY